MNSIDASVGGHGAHWNDPLRGDIRSDERRPEWSYVFGGPGPAHAGSLARRDTVHVVISASARSSRPLACWGGLTASPPTVSPGRARAMNVPFGCSITKVVPPSS
jgi:hypothetical protein